MRGLSHHNKLGVAHSLQSVQNLQSQYGQWKAEHPNTAMTFDVAMSTAEVLLKKSRGKVEAKSRNKPPPPNPQANGQPHTIIERSGRDGQYTTYYGDGTWKQYRGSGQDHGGILRPNIKETRVNKHNGTWYINGTIVRTPRQDEYPK